MRRLSGSLCQARSPSNVQGRETADTFGCSSTRLFRRGWRAGWGRLLTEAMDDRPDLGFRSYDRFFPSQDTLPRGGFGNLIALPLQREPRRAGNSVFVDAELNPLADQWAHLSQLGRITSKQAEFLVEQAEKNGRVLGVRTVISHGPVCHRTVERAPVPQAHRTGHNNTDSRQFGDPRPSLHPQGGFAAERRHPADAAGSGIRISPWQAMRLPTYGKPRVVACAEDGARFIELPRGCLEEAEALLRGLGIELSIQDQRYPGLSLTVSFQGVLRPEQETAANAMLAHDTGVLAATTAFGKTVRGRVADRSTRCQHTDSRSSKTTVGTVGHPVGRIT